MSVNGNDNRQLAVNVSKTTIEGVFVSPLPKGHPGQYEGVGNPTCKKEVHYNVV